MGSVEKIDVADIVLLAEDEKGKEVKIKVKKIVSNFC